MAGHEPTDRKNLGIEKEVVKEAIEEWLDKQFATFGKWSLVGILCALGAWAFFRVAVGAGLAQIGG